MQEVREREVSMKWNQGRIGCTNKKSMILALGAWEAENGRKQMEHSSHGTII